MKLKPTLSVIVASIVTAIAVWLFMDAVTWISGFKRYTIFFERVFGTSESLANTMRFVQAITAIVIGGGYIGTLILLERHGRHQ